MPNQWLETVSAGIRKRVQSLYLYRQVNRVRRSSLFDQAYYLAANPEALRSGLDPALHYVTLGARELLDPAAAVNARMLLTQVPPFRVGIDNPIFFLEDHYIAKGRPLPDKRLRAPMSVCSLLDNLHPEDGACEDIGTQTIDIIVPVYNNAGKLKPLLETLKMHTPYQHTVILIDDGSTEQCIPRLLTEFSQTRDNVEVITNQHNTGFAASVNRGLRHSANHKILLNSDTIVPDGWIDRLIAPILRDPTIASVTPYSNASTYTGFPENRIDLPLSGPSEIAARNQTLSLFTARDRDVLCGVGFCIAINSAAIAAVGELDETAFQHGYYEDTDWCYRAGKAGFRNVLANRLFVGHDHTSSSFGNTRKLAALAISETRMNAKHPDYFEEMNAFYLADPHQDLRRQSELIAACCSAEHAIAIFESDRPQSGDELARKISSTIAFGKTCALRIVQGPDGLRITVHCRHLNAELTASDLREVFKFLKLLNIGTIVVGDEALLDNIAAFAEQLRTHRETSNCTIVKTDAMGAFQVPTAAREQNRPLHIAVIGPAPGQGGWDNLGRLIDHVQAAGEPCRIAILGDCPDDWIKPGNISKTGIYRLENIPVLLRHYDADVVYFPSARTHIFACTYRQLMTMRLPIVTHRSKRTEELAQFYDKWTVVSGNRSDQIFTSIKAAGSMRNLTTDAYG